MHSINIINFPQANKNYLSSVNSSQMEIKNSSSKQDGSELPTRESLENSTPKVQTFFGSTKNTLNFLKPASRSSEFDSDIDESCDENMSPLEVPKSQFLKSLCGINTPKASEIEIKVEELSRRGIS